MLTAIDERLAEGSSWDFSDLRVEAVTGDIGTDNVVMQQLSLEPPTGGVARATDPWILHFEADVKDASGSMFRMTSTDSPAARSAATLSGPRRA